MGRSPTPSLASQILQIGDGSRTLSLACQAPQSEGGEYLLNEEQNKNLHFVEKLHLGIRSPGVGLNLLILILNLSPLNLTGIISYEKQHPFYLFYEFYLLYIGFSVNISFFIQVLSKMKQDTEK